MSDTYAMENHTGWGDHIGWAKYPTSINGHLSHIPSEGDYITCQMKTGKIGVFQIVKVERCHDPRDMFFADVEPLGYTDDPDMDIPDEVLSKSKLMLR